MKRTAWMLAGLGMVLAAGAGWALAQSADGSGAVGPKLKAADVLALVKRLGEYGDSLPAAAKMDVGEIAAYEENSRFAYALGETRLPGAGPGKSHPQAALVRRFIFLKPSTLVVDDHVTPTAGGAAGVRWRLVSKAAPEVSGPRVAIAEGGRKLICTTMLPRSAAPRAAGQDAGAWTVEVAPRAKGGTVRFLHVFDTGDPPEASRPTLDRKGNGLVEVSLAAGGLTWTLDLPAADESPGTISAVNPEGKMVLGPRQFPSGILPHGPQGARILERWDEAYREGRRAAWDLGRASSQLRKAAEGGTIRPCATVELGCGTGNDAVYLQAKGFGVTAIDISPTALATAAQKARQAGVVVRWVLADVLAPPRLATFEFVFDRGCYHAVRRRDAAGYVRTLKGLTHAGSRALIIAGNANEPRTFGPPRVAEQDIRGDFSEAFEIVWLRETRFDTREADEKGALVWSILLKRKDATAPKRPSDSK